MKRTAILGFALLTLLPMGVSAQEGADSVQVPDSLFAPVGTLVTVQTVDFLSSDDNREGDGFLAVLYQPLVVDGWVVARPGQTVLGVVVRAERAGRTSGTSHLAVALSELLLVDGQQVPVRTQLALNTGRTTRGEDAATIATGTGLGAVIGATAGGSRGATIGAAIGAGAGVAGVLATRGNATEIPAESVLTFRLDAPLAISTQGSARAFNIVRPEDYDSAPTLRLPTESDRRRTSGRPRARYHVGISTGPFWYYPHHVWYPSYPRRYSRIVVVPRPSPRFGRGHYRR